jgi:hypothetical protein
VNSRDILLVFAALAACDGGGGGKGDDGSPTTGDTGTPPPPGGTDKVWINEVMAMNQGTWADEDLTYPDWIELWNPNDAAVDLGGWWMSDDVDDPFNWQIPDGVTIAPGAYLVIFADDDEIQGDLHASFHIAGLGGEDVALFGPNVLDNPLVDSVEDMSVQSPDISFARMPDGGPTLTLDDTPTPAASNN